MILSAIFTLIAIASLFLFQHWFENFDRSNDPDEREKLSVKWHAAQWATLFFIVATFIQVHEAYYLIVPAINGMIVWWWVFDAYKGLKYGRGILYAGEGKGSSIEKFVYWLAVKKLNTSFKWFYVQIKVWAFMLMFAFDVWWY